LFWLAPFPVLLWHGSNIFHVLGFGTFMVPVEEAIYVVCEITCLEV
jgi:hypothetical protein